MIYIHQPEKAVSFTRLPNFLFEAPTFTPQYIIDACKKALDEGKTRYTDGSGDFVGELRSEWELTLVL